MTRWLSLAGLALAIILTPMARATFSGVNGPIVFVNCGAGDGQLYRINPDGTGRQRLTSGFSGVTEPSVSPDGRRIAFRSAANNTLYIAHRDGSAPVIVRGSGGVAVSGPAWTPNGQRLIFGCDLDPASAGLCTILADGGLLNSPSLIPGTQRGDAEPDIRPDGNEIAFVRQTTTSNIHTIAIGGGTATVLTNCPGSSGGCNSPSYAPDTTGLAFELSNTLGQSCVAKLTFPVGAPVVPACLANSPPGTDQTPVYSPDGLEIVADAVSGPLARLGASGSGRVVLDNGLPGSCTPSWARGSTPIAAEALCGHIYFDAHRKAEARKGQLAVKFIAAGCDADALAGLAPALVKFNAAIDRIAALANSLIDRRGGEGECDPDLQPLLPLARVDLLGGAPSGEDYLSSTVLQTCDFVVS